MPDQTAVPPADATTEARIAAAFGALATTDVPTAAPRPTRAPRPPAREDRNRRRRFGLATGGVLVAAAAVVIALVVGGEVNDARETPTAPPGTDRVSSQPPTSTTPTTPPPSTPDTTPTGATPGSTAPASFGAVTTAFTGATRSSRSPVVVVPGGYEGADLDGGTIRFWTWNGSAWRVDGTSTYLPNAQGNEQGPAATIDGASLLAGMEHATFLVEDQYATGDGTGVAITYTDGPDGWGAIVAGSDANLHPSGHGITALGQDGALYDGALENGQLVTVDCSDTAPDNASCGLPQFQVRKYWTWDGTQFVLDRREGPAS